MKIVLALIGVGLLFFALAAYEYTPEAKQRRALAKAEIRDAEAAEKTRSYVLSQMPAEQRGCLALRSAVRDKRIADLTVRQTELLAACRALGY